jgi:hypothetical protein
MRACKAFSSSCPLRFEESLTFYELRHSLEEKMKEGIPTLLKQFKNGLASGFDLIYDSDDPNHKGRTQ